MDLIICILFIMLFWNLIKMVKAKTEQIERGSKRHKTRH